MLPLDLEADRPTPDEEYASEEEKNCLRQVVTHLAPRYRAVLEADLAGKASEEIAREMAVPVKKVYSLRHKAKREAMQLLLLVLPQNAKKPKMIIHSIHHGPTFYQLKLPKTATITPSTSGKAVLITVEEFPMLRGEGPDVKAALKNWSMWFHVTFQRLFVKQLFEMDDQERSLWDTIERTIDLERYRDSQPWVKLQQGQVQYVNSLPARVLWLGSEELEDVDLERMPAEFASYKDGQRFEALVQRHRRTYELIEVESIRQLNLPSSEEDDEDDDEALWDTIPKALPDTNW